MDKKILAEGSRRKRNCLQRQQHQKKIVCVDEMSTPPLQKNNGPSLILTALLQIDGRLSVYFCHSE
jgi:hypothetical protein